MSTSTMPRLKARYNDEVRGQLQTELELGNPMEVPRLEKIVLNVGAGAAVDNKGKLLAVARLGARHGQQEGRAVGRTLGWPAALEEALFVAPSQQIEATGLAKQNLDSILTGKEAIDAQF